ncbi:MAG: glutamate racemase [Bacteroidetes bacterium]|nr:MAG: glutamate racemase [Bacteroidota bacterium]REK03440.1 MAG: glutamate racemase [Bacteroidota bacterium]REK34448.1 MAG: glutamate racemase [Bacteroidota bacterium]REK50434.1 MAG: glutamate racemase [Bacteroidota bacterium]
MPQKNNKQDNSRPIGIFDSGIGGLTVANAINKVLPHETLVYFGDTAHLPYGDKSPDSIKYYALRISQFLLKQNCKMIVIACNTASSLAYETVKEFVGKAVPVINVIDPVVQHVIRNKKIKHVGVIGTKGTIKSDIYHKKIKAASGRIEVSSLATPLLAPMIEEGFFDNKISRSIISSYLDSRKLSKIDSIILACTHYPLIRKEVEEYYKGSVNIIDTAGVVADHVRETLEKLKLSAVKKNKKPLHHFYVSDFTPSFEQSTKYFFSSKIHLEKMDFWS